MTAVTDAVKSSYSLKGKKDEKHSPGYFPALTGVRAISAYFVFLHHYNSFKDGSFLHDFVGGLHIGVSIFFVLSGFLIAYRYYYTGPIVFRKYFVNRFARIYPMYFLLTSLTFLVAGLVLKTFTLTDLKLYLLSLTFLKGFFDEYKFAGIAQGWSLTVEETFYLSAPVIFALVRFRKYFMGILPVIFAAIGLSLVFLSNHLSLHSFFQSDRFMFAYTFFGRVFEFFVGISLALLYKRYSDRIRSGWITYTGFLLILMNVIWLIAIKRTGNYHYGVEHPFGMVVNNIFLPLSGIAVFFWGLLKEETIFKRLLSTDVMVLLGKSSYIFYLIHIGFIAHYLEKISGNIIVNFVVLNIISIALFSYIEEPVNHYLRRKLV